MTVYKCEYVLIGLPDTGKTTFLAALWHVVNSSEIESQLSLERLHDDHGYLNHIHQRWANAEIQHRTIPSSEQHVSMILTGDCVDGEIELCIPDLSGESYESAWTYRKINNERAESISNSEGILLFIHPERVVEETLISQFADLEEDDPVAEDEEDELVSWDSQNAPTQIQLVDLLQSLMRINARRPLRVGVVVSAWDRIQGQEVPADWVRQRLPLLWQFLKSNDDQLTSAFFGVSAQGGELPEDADRLRELDEPIERIRIIDEEGRASSDITSPIRWLIAATDR